MQLQRICIPGAVSTSTRISRSTLLPTAANLRRGWARSVAAPYSSLKAKKCRTDTIGLLDTARSYRLHFEVDWEKNQDSRGKRKRNGATSSPRLISLNSRVCTQIKVARVGPRRVGRGRRQNSNEEENRLNLTRATELERGSDNGVRTWNWKIFGALGFDSRLFPIEICCTHPSSLVGC